jgi:hypothetical protein
MKKLNCPSCNEFLSFGKLKSVPTKPRYFVSWDIDRFCPKCDTQLTYNAFPQIIVAIGSIYFVGTILFNLFYPYSDKKLFLSISGVLFYGITLFIWQKYKKLVKVK